MTCSRVQEPFTTGYYVTGMHTGMQVLILQLRIFIEDVPRYRRQNTGEAPMTGTLSFRIITGDKRPFLPLILCADPDTAVVEKYLDRGILFVAYCGEIPACVAVVIPVSADECELKALATDEQFRHWGIASAMIRFLFEHFRGRYSSIIVGTAEPAVSFYQQSGFVWFRTDPGFFTRNYPEPIYDGDFLCRDMEYLRKDL